MQYAMEVGGRVRQVAVRRTSQGFVVTIDGRESTVDAARVSANAWSLIVDGVSREAIVTAGRNGASIVEIGSTSVAVSQNGKRRWGGRDSLAGAGPQRIAAPMPGKIVRVLARPGDAVGARQPLVVIEAMKMENELRAGRGGTVVEVNVVEGQSVEAGALLAVVAAAE